MRTNGLSVVMLATGVLIGGVSYDQWVVPRPAEADEPQPTTSARELCQQYPSWNTQTCQAIADDVDKALAMAAGEDPTFGEMGLARVHELCEQQGWDYYACETFKNDLEKIHQDARAKAQKERAARERERAALEQQRAEAEAASTPFASAHAREVCTQHPGWYHATCNEVATELDKIAAGEPESMDWSGTGGFCDRQSWDYWTCEKFLPELDRLVNNAWAHGATARARKICGQHPSWGKNNCAAVARREVIIGMTMEQVLAAWGNPMRSNETVTAAGTDLQLVYGGDRYIYLAGPSLSRTIVYAIQR